MTGLAGLRGTGDWGTDERPKNFRELILRRNPNGSTPIFALMARVAKESTDDPEFNWWDEPNDIVRLQVNGALLSTDTTIVVDSADPSASAPSNVWGEATHLKPGDLLLVEPTTDQATFAHEVIMVESVQSATQFTAARGAAGSTAAAIANDAFLFLIGSAYAEGTSEPDAATRNPVKYNNFTQIFKTSYEVTGTAAQTRLRTGDALKNERMRKAWDHSRQIEMAILFGRKSETVGSNGKPMRTFDGIRRFIPASNTTIHGGAPDTFDGILDAMHVVFDYDTPAGDTRMLFCGNGYLNTITKIARASGQIEWGDRIKVLEMNFRELILPQGRFLIKTHPLLNRHSLYKDSAFALDFSALRWRPMKGRDTRFKDNIQTDGEDVVRGEWRTEGGLEVRYGGTTLGYFSSLTA